MNPTTTTIQTLLGQTDARRPSAAEFADELFQKEKQARKEKHEPTYERLIGTWNLRFVTGTQKWRRKVGIFFGAGRFIPAWLVKFHIQYSADSPISSATGREDSIPLLPDIGTVRNSIKLGLITVTFTGPTKFWQKTNRLAFDFAYVSIAIAGKTIYRQEVRGGEQRMREFSQQTLKDQEFFSFFFVEKDALAARGGGGGVAFWTRVAE